MYIPRDVRHAFDCVSEQPGKLLVVIQPARDMENFFRGVAELLAVPGAPDIAAMQKLYATHESAIVGPPVSVK